MNGPLAPRGIFEPNQDTPTDVLTVSVRRSEVAFRFADQIYRFRSVRPGVPVTFDASHLPFVVSVDREPTCDIECDVGPTVASAGPIVFGAGGPWELRRLADGSEEVLFRCGEGWATPWSLLTIAPDFRSARLVDAPGPEGLSIRVDTKLEFLVSRMVGRRNSLMIHASFAVIDRGALVFVGHSGAGKSTMAAIAERHGATIPTDDRVLITLSGDRPTAWGTPWYGTLQRKSPDGAPIRAIFLLQQATENALEAVTNPDAVGELFARLIQPRLAEEEMRATLASLESLVARVPVRRLHFTATPDSFALAAGFAESATSARAPAGESQMASNGVLLAAPPSVQRSTMSTEYRRSDRYVYRLTVGEHMLVALHSTSPDPLFALTPTAAVLWQELAHWRRSTDLAATLTGRFDVTLEEASADVAEFLEQLDSLSAVSTREVWPMPVTIPSVSATKVRGRMVHAARRDRVPVDVDIEIIATCNFKCVHCYIAPCAEREDVMALHEAEAIFDKLQAAGTLNVLLTGGEVFTHKEFKQIYMAAKNRGFNVFINTNAYLIGRRWADFFADWPPARVSISMYGTTPESYERLTGIPRSYERVMQAIDLLLARGIAIELKCPAMTITAAELPIMRAFAESKGVGFRTDYNIIPQEKGDLAPLDFQLPLATRMQVELGTAEQLEDLRSYAGPRVDGNTTQSVYKCGAGRTTLHVNVHGGVSTCSTSRKVVGNLLTDPFDDVWATLGLKVSQTYPPGHPCGSCKFSRMCSGCPALVEQMTGLPNGYVQDYCRVTHQQAFALGYHPTGIPRTVSEGVPSFVPQPHQASSRSLPVLA
ncbi:MAG: hypothetical protein NVS4B3_26340 [Gemmatimonadaceae bacterium]